MAWPSHLLRIDSTAGLVVGTAEVLAAPWLSPFFGLPLVAIYGLAAANLLYGLYAFSLARRSVRPRPLLHVLIGANAAWAVFCWILVALLLGTATVFGLLHLAAEGLFVGGLALLEWRHREALLVAPGA